MNSTKQEYKNWQAFISNLGSRVTTRTNKKVWMDLEHFIVLGAKYANEDARIFTAFTHICIILAPILSPFKIKKIINSLLLKDDEFKIIGLMISNIQKSVRNKAQWNNLLMFCKEKADLNKEFKLFKSSSFKVAPELKEWNLVASGLELDNNDKYLNSKKMFNLSIVKMRFNGVKAVYSDLLFYRELNGENESLNQISKKIYHDYNSVYQANEHILIAA